MAISATRPSLKELKESWQNRSYPDEQIDSISLRDPKLFTWLNRPTDTTSPVRLTDLKGMAGGCMYDTDRRGAMLPTVWTYGSPLPPRDEVIGVDNLTISGSVTSKNIIKTGGKLQSAANDVISEVRLQGYVLPGQGGQYSAHLNAWFADSQYLWGGKKYLQFIVIGATNNYLSGSTSQHYYWEGSDNNGTSGNATFNLSESYPYVSFLFYTIIKGDPSGYVPPYPKRIAEWYDFKCTKV